MDLGTLGWIVAIVLIVATASIIALAVWRRGQAEAGGQLGPFSFRASTRTPPGEATIRDSTSGGDAIAHSDDGDASIAGVKAKGDLRARAGGALNSPKAPENGQKTE